MWWKPHMWWKLGNYLWIKNGHPRSVHIIKSKNFTCSKSVNKTFTRDEVDESRTSIVRSNSSFQVFHYICGFHHIFSYDSTLPCEKKIVHETSVRNSEYMGKHQLCGGIVVGA